MAVRVSKIENYTFVNTNWISLVDGLNLPRIVLELEIYIRTAAGFVQFRKSQEDTKIANYIEGENYVARPQNEGINLDGLQIKGAITDVIEIEYHTN